MATKKFWKLTKSQNKLLFVILGISAVAAPTGAIIYSIVSKPTYSNKDPWVNAIDLNSTLDKYFNDKLSPNRTRFKVGESKDVGIFVNENDIFDISQLLVSGSEWMSELSESDLKEMLSGTGVSITEEKKLIFNGKEMKELALFPTILKYPYDGENKFGEVYFSPSNKEAGIFKYNVRFCLRLGIVGFDNNKHDLKKDYDFTLRHDQETTLPVLLSLMNNQSIQKFIAVNEPFNSNESILKGLLGTYYNLSNNKGMDFCDQITPKKGGSLPNSNKYIYDGANATSIHVKYDSKSISDLNKLGASLYNQHIGDFNIIETIFNKIGISMPTFENDTTGFQIRKRDSNSWSEMNSNEMNTYKGYVNYGSSDGKAITDDEENWLFQSEHKIFTNKVNIKFLDAKKSANIYYDQKPYSRGSINYDNYNIENDISDVVNKIQYNDSIDCINEKLSGKKSQIENSISNTIKNSLDRSGVSQTVFDKVNVNPPSVSSFSKPTEATRKDSENVYFDKSINFNNANSEAYFLSRKELSKSHYINGKTINDPFGKEKHNLSILDINMPNGKWDTNSSEWEILESVKDSVYRSISEKMNQTGFLHKNKNEYSEMSYKLNGPIKGGKLNAGEYSVTISAPSSLWNFKGSKTTKTFYIPKAPDPEPEE